MVRVKYVIDKWREAIIACTRMGHAHVVIQRLLCWRGNERPSINDLRAI